MELRDWSPTAPSPSAVLLKASGPSAIPTPNPCISTCHAAMCGAGLRARVPTSHIALLWGAEQIQGLLETTLPR